MNSYSGLNNEYIYIFTVATMITIFTYLHYFLILQFSLPLRNPNPL